MSYTIGCGYPVRDETSTAFKTRPCGSLDTVEEICINTPDKDIIVPLCTAHYYIALQLKDWQVANMVRDGVLVLT